MYKHDIEAIVSFYFKVNKNFIVCPFVKAIKLYMIRQDGQTRDSRATEELH